MQRAKDSFESLGQLFYMGRQLVAIGRDQADSAPTPL